MENKKMDLFRLEKALFEEIQNSEKPLTLQGIKENNNYQPEELEEVKRALMDLLENHCIKNIFREYSSFEYLAGMKFEATPEGVKIFKNLANEDRFNTAEVICKEIGDYTLQTFLTVYEKLKWKEMDKLIDKYCGSKWTTAEDGSYKPKTIFDDAPQK